MADSIIWRWAGDALSDSHFVSWLRVIPSASAAAFLDGNVVPYIVTGFAAFVFPGIPPSGIVSA